MAVNEAGFVAVVSRVIYAAPHWGVHPAVLWFCVEVPDRGALRHETAAQIEDSHSYWCGN